MLQVEHVTCGYGGSPVIADISFRVREGERLCILGPNGCGKTTLLRAMTGLLPCQGAIKIQNTDLRQLTVRQRAKKLALMSQLTPASFDYTVYETVMLGRYARQKGGLLARQSSEDRQAVETSLTLTGTWELRDRLVTELSGGQLQRVFLARTFAQDPQVIALDEPTNHLDLRCQIELIDSLRAWAAGGGRCVVGVFHDINLALTFADRVLLLENGRILADEQVDRFDPAILNGLYGMDVRAHMQATLRRWL